MPLPSKFGLSWQSFKVTGAPLLPEKGLESTEILEVDVPIMVEVDQRAATVGVERRKTGGLIERHAWPGDARREAGEVV